MAISSISIFDKVRPAKWLMPWLQQSPLDIVFSSFALTYFLLVFVIVLCVHYGKKTNDDDDDGSNKTRIPTNRKDNFPMGHNTTMGHNKNKDMDGNSILPKDRFVCSREEDIDNPFHQEI